MSGIYSRGSDGSHIDDADAGGGPLILCPSGGGRPSTLKFSTCPTLNIRVINVVCANRTKVNFQSVIRGHVNVITDLRPFSVVGSAGLRIGSTDYGSTKSRLVAKFGF